MISLKGNPYRLSLLDTNAMSELAKEPALLAKFLVWCQVDSPQYIPCFSAFSLVELRRNNAVYQKFLKEFENVPCILLKGYEQLLEEEVNCYPNPANVQPILATFVGPQGLPGNHLTEWLATGFGSESVQQQERTWNNARQMIVDDIVTLVDNFPPSGASYTPAELREFVEIASFEQIARRQRNFANQQISAGGAISIEAFPSVKASTYTVFYKFYADRTRRPSSSDAFDILISASSPYVDAIVTENHQAEALRKLANQDDFVQALRILTMRDLRQLP